MSWPAEPLKAMLHRDADRLVERILQLALARGFTDQTSSMRAAWREATDRLNACLIDYLTEAPGPRGLDGRTDYRNDPRFARLQEVAYRHHGAGVPLELHHGLFKLYRRTYLDHFRALHAGSEAASGTPEPAVSAGDSGTGTAGKPASWMGDLDALLDSITDFFDEADQAMLAPWASFSASEAALADRVRRLTRERDQYFGALESLRGLVFITDEHGTLLMANATALQAFLGMTDTGAFTYRLAQQSHRTELQAIVTDVLQAGDDSDDTLMSGVWLNTHQGSRCFDIRLRLIEDSVYKLDRCRIILMNDVTAHLNAIERAQRAERTMSLFLAAMSHEIRGPLHSVLGASELLRDAGPLERARLLELLEVSARALSDTLDNVLSFSRFEHQAPQPRPRPVALHAVFHDLIRTADIQARQLGVPLRAQIDPQLPATVQLDWPMTQQILGNLIRNALQHDDGRGVSVSASHDGDRLVFTISDHGPGLPEEVRPLLGDEPAELRPRTTGRNGSGLGLAIAQRMTLALGGRIEARRPHDGACLQVSLPLVATTSEPARPAPGTSSRLEKTCLLIDDDAIGAMGTIAMLERLVHSVDHAATLAQAHALCQAQPDAYDVFIVDLHLPDGSGIDFARAAKADPQRRDKPVLLLSGNLDALQRTPGVDGLFAALLEKPLKADALGQAIRLSARPSATASPLLDGLSPAAQQRMASTFADNWRSFHRQLSAVDACTPDRTLALKAHKLASGAAVFGQTRLAQALRALEHALPDDKASSPANAPVDPRLSGQTGIEAHDDPHAPAQAASAPPCQGFDTAPADRAGQHDAWRTARQTLLDMTPPPADWPDTIIRGEHP